MTAPKPRLVGVNHVALEVSDVEQALHFYSKIFTFEIRGTHKDGEGRLQMAFIDMGDQFLALSRGRHQRPDADRHFGLVVDDRSLARELAIEAGATMVEGSFLDFLDPWGNRVEVVEYGDLQFTKSAAVLQAMHLDLPKTIEAREELRKKSMI